MNRLRKVEITEGAVQITAVDLTSVMFNTDDFWAATKDHNPADFDDKTSIDLGSFKITYLNGDVIIGTPGGNSFAVAMKKSIFEQIRMRSSGGVAAQMRLDFGGSCCG